MIACPDCPDRAQCQAEDECIDRREAATDSSPGIPEWDEQPIGSEQIAQRRAIGAPGRVRSMLRDGSPGPLRLADRSKAKDGLC